MIYSAKFGCICSRLRARFKEWKTLVKRALEHIVKVLRTNNDGEYVSNGCDDLLSKNNISRQNSSPYTLHQTGWWNKPIAPLWRWRVL